MPSVIAENRPNEHLSIKHDGRVNEGIDDTDSDEVKAWAPAYEAYTLQEVNGATELTVHMDLLPEYQAFFANAWPRTLETITKLAEPPPDCADRPYAWFRTCPT